MFVLYVPSFATYLDTHCSKLFNPGATIAPLEAIAVVKEETALRTAFGFNFEFNALLSANAPLTAKHPPNIIVYIFFMIISAPPRMFQRPLLLSLSLIFVLH